MDALLTLSARVLRRGMPLLVTILAATHLGAGYRTRNFMVQTHDPGLARAIAESAEQYRKTLAIQWLGRELPPWPQPCPIVAKVAPQLGAGGVTSFMFDRGRPFDWRMTIEGSAERVLDSVLPHEVTHTIFATHFGGPLPRWADEGACTTVEHASERAKHDRMLHEFLTTNRGIPFNQMVAMSEYPPDILPLYAQGHSVVDFLVRQGGHQAFIQFVEQAMQGGDWNRALRTTYPYQDLSDLQVNWVNWLRDGRPNLDSTPKSPSQQVPALLAKSEPVGRSWYAKQRNSAAMNGNVAATGGEIAAPAPQAGMEGPGMQGVGREGPRDEGQWSSVRPREPQQAAVQILEWDDQAPARAALDWPAPPLRR